jgi:formate-dependent nitrite reductase membrane component NrfD
MMSYPGVLLSTTSTPMWAKSRLLGALLACSSFSDAVSATSLALALRGGNSYESLRRLERIERVARIAEAIVLGAYLVTARKTVKPMLKGRYGWQFWLGAVGAGLLLPALMNGRNARRQRPSLKGTIFKSLISLAGGFALKWVITQAGRRSALDVEISREVTKPSDNAPGWNKDSA